MKYLPLFAVAILLYSCQSEKANNVPMYADFLVRYLETEQQVKAHAAFYEGDTIAGSQAVTFDRAVTFQGQDMQARQIVEDRSMRYIFNGTGGYDGKFVYTYPNPKGGSHTYEIAMSPIGEFSVKDGIASLSDGMVLQLNNQALSANEKLVLLFTSENNVSAGAEFKGPFDVSELKIPAVQLVDVQPGKNFLYLVKTQINTARIRNMDITSSIEFYTNTIEIQVIE